MRRGARVLAVGWTTLVAALLGSGSAFGQGQPQGPPTPCPDSFVLAPSVVLPPPEGDKTDRNDDGFVCVKITEGPNPQVVAVDNTTMHLPPG